MRKVLFPVLLTMLALAAVFAACGDDDDASSPETAATRQSGESTAAASSGGSDRGLIGNLRSFEYEMSFSGMADLIGSVGGGTGSAPNAADVKITGAYKSPDRSTFTMNLGGQELTNIIIGAQQWVKIGTTWVGPTPAGESAKDSVLAIALWDEGFKSNAPDFRCPDAKVEKVNGVDARQCSMDEKTIRQLASAFGEDNLDLAEMKDSKFDIWLAKDGDFPVRFRFTATDRQTNKPIAVVMDLKNVNGDVKIDPPKT